MEENNLGLYAMQLASSSVLPMVLKAATDLGVLDIIARAGPGSFLSASQIASQLVTGNLNQPDPHSIDRILRFLASYSIVTCSIASSDGDKDGQPHRLFYGLAPVAKYFLKNQDGGSLAPILNLIQDRAILDMWFNLKDAVLEGGVPFKRAHGMSTVEYVTKDPRFLEVFRAAMKDLNSLFMEEILREYKGFESLESLVDVGGGDGSVLNIIVSKHPTIKATNFDLPAVIEASPSYPGIEHVAGDMFVSIPKGDAIFIKWVLHMWDDEHCVKVLRNCYEALPENGKVIAVDVVIPETPEATLDVKSLLQFELFATNLNPMRKDRTRKQFESLAKAAGFSQIRIPSSAFCFSVVEFHKNV